MVKKLEFRCLEGGPKNAKVIKTEPEYFKHIVIRTENGTRHMFAAVAKCPSGKSEMFRIVKESDVDKSLPLKTEHKVHKPKQKRKSRKSRKSKKSKK